MQRTNVVALSSSIDVFSCSNTQNGPSVEKVNPAGHKGCGCNSGTSGMFESASSQASAPSTLSAILIEQCEALLNGPSVENFMKSSESTSGPGNKVNPPGCKRRSRNRGALGRFESASWASTPSTLNANLMKRCEALLKKLMQHQYGWIFNSPVDAVQLNIPDYLTVIKHPMDLGTIKSKIASSEYTSPLDFVADVRLTFSNAVTYNPPGNDVHFIADALSKFFEARWKVIANELPKDSQSLPEKSGLHEPLPLSKKSNTQNGPSVEEVNPPGHKGCGWNSGASGGFESESQASASSTLNAISIKQCEALLNGPSAENFKKSSGLTSELGNEVNPPGHKRRNWNRGTPGMFESSSWALAPSTLRAISIKQCEALLKNLMQHQYGWVFNTPVDVVKLNNPDYLTVIKHPMDLGTIKSKIALSEYSSPLDFVADVRLTFSNAMTYNPPGNDVHFMADTLSKFFEARWKVIVNKLPVNSQPLPKKTGLHEEEETIKLMPPSKKRKLTSPHHEVMPDRVKRIMTYEEKRKLSREFEALLGELPDNIFEFVREQISNGWEAEEDEIEIYIDDLSDDTLFMLRKVLDDYLQEINKNQAKAKPCKKEVLNESGLSNLSMQLCNKGNYNIENGGNEPPVSSHTPVEIEKDTGRRSNTFISSGSSRGNSGLPSCFHASKQ